MIDLLKSKENKIAVIGLGYVGLPLALELGKQYSVVGFDINEKKIESFLKGEDPNKEIPGSSFENKQIGFTGDETRLREASIHIVAVPTPIDQNNMPDLRFITLACEIVGRNMKQGDLVIFESTVFPGCTEEHCVPILEKISGMKLYTDFKIGYSPERMSPGDPQNNLSKIARIVSACDEESLDVITELYQSIVEAPIHRAPSIKVAEAAKLTENIQRDVNISLVNELAILFDKMDIDTHDVLEAAGTKWNFHKYYPGLVGGHCISIDPYYLVYKSKQYGHEPQVILSGRQINDEVPTFISKKLVQKFLRIGKNPIDCKVLIMGVTFKPNVSDIRNTKVVDLINELRGYSIQVDIVDEYALSEEFEKEYGLKLLDQPGWDYDAIILSVPHTKYVEMHESAFIEMMNGSPILIDVSGKLNVNEEGIDYWRL